MSTRKAPKAPTPAAGKLIFLLLLILALALAWIFLTKRSGKGEAGIHPTDTNATTAVGAESARPTAETQTKKPNTVFAALVGRWLREDGGYVLDITGVDPDGKLAAAYYNPRPIHVSRAAAVQERGGIKIGIELNDVNYPGCLYTLVFNPELDQLQGTYFQAAQGQTYQIVFVRVPVQ